MISTINKKKKSIQFIFATHNANIPVLGDAECVISTQKVKFVESKNQIDKEIDRLEEKIKLSFNETEVVTDNELTRELMKKYVESIF